MNRDPRMSGLTICPFFSRKFGGPDRAKSGSAPDRFRNAGLGEPARRGAARQHRDGPRTLRIRDACPFRDQGASS